MYISDSRFKRLHTVWPKEPTRFQMTNQNGVLHPQMSLILTKQLIIHMWCFSSFFAGKPAAHAAVTRACSPMMREDKVLKEILIWTYGGNNWTAWVNQVTALILCIWSSQMKRSWSRKRKMKSCQIWTIDTLPHSEGMLGLEREVSIQWAGCWAPRRL